MFDQALFSECHGPEAKRLFKAHVSNVEVETFSYCNRVCSYCPNADHDRRSFNEFMSPKHLEMICRDLADIEYSGGIVVSHYNEPLSRPDIVDHISMFRKACPHATINIFSNGDYLTRELYEQIAEAGLDNLFVSIHLAGTEAFDDKKIINRVIQMSLALGIPAEITHLDPGLMVHAQFKAPELKHFWMLENNFTELGSDRGGLLDTVKNKALRQSPCAYPFYSFNISYGGNISPCCQIRGDISEFKNALIGNLDGFDTIFDAYGSAIAANWRRDLFTYSPKEGPCKTCNAQLVDIDEAGIASRAEFLKSLELL